MSAVSEPDALVGRAADLERISSLLTSGGALLRGPAGIGKSAILRRIARDRAESGRVVGIEGNEASGAVPFGPFAQVLTGRDPGAGPEPIDRAAAVRDALEGTTLLVVDDAHRLDAASAGLVHRLADEGVTLLVAVRAGEQLPPAIESLWTRGLLTSHEVTPLDAEAIEAYTASRLGGPVDAGLVRALRHASGGVPLYARELLRGGLDSGAIRHHRGVWVLRGQLTAGGGLASALRDHLGSQPPGIRRAVHCLALTEPIGLELMASLMTEAELERAELEGLLRIDGDAEHAVVRLGHPLYRSVVTAELTLSRRRRLADLLLRSVDRLGTEVDPTLLARWRLERGDDRSPDEWLQAAHRVTPTDLTLAEAFVRAAVAAGGGPAALLALASLLTHQHRLEEAETVFGELAAIPVPPEVRIAIASVEAFLLAMPGQRPDAALDLIAEVTASAGFSPELESARALALWRSGRIVDSIPIGRAVARDPAASVVARTSAALTVCSAEIYALRFSDGEFGVDLTLMDELVARARTELPEGPESAALVRGSRATMPIPDLPAGLRLSAEGAQRALMNGDDGVRAQFAMLHGWMLAVSGDLLASLEELTEAHAGHGVWVPTTLPWLRSSLVRVLSATGAAAEARQLLEEIEASPRAALYDPDVALARAAVHEAEGDADTALAVLRGATAASDEGGNRLRGDELWLRRLRLGDEAVAGEVHRRYRRREGPAAAAVASHAAAVRDRDLRAIPRAVGALADAGLLWDAAEAQADLVRRLRATGDAPATWAAVERLVVLLGRTRGLALTSVTGELHATLTPREREVAGLAASLSDREVAERLGISVRTAQTHLTHVYAKLRISGRAELGRHLAEHAGGTEEVG
ncbi:helix-turn-helix transcriptional regulator [Protaetiibacter intestinalis]|uniref:Helix-turn-helix transcriptional regulator n=1 Tax=Protaetiibacter intestinalis TaxID=2419774 RepID=A0A387B3L6_9MICO|nr:LuxR family transcriptional regulator [Protaetiibacter intestinalis]AYF97013.1 helix-turn-helix transcriptional regulator [Protaetiibacter intestinalis]